MEGWAGGRSKMSQIRLAWTLKNMNCHQLISRKADGSHSFTGLRIGKTRFALAMTTESTESVEEID